MNIFSMCVSLVPGIPDKPGNHHDLDQDKDDNIMNIISSSICNSTGDLTEPPI